MPNILCSIFDSKAAFWSAPRTFRNKADALRSFEMAINSGDGYGMHPEDFGLFYIGDFDEDTGFVVAVTPVVIEIGINLVKQVENDK